MFSKNIFSERVKHLRETHNLMQKELAAKMNITDKTISMIETKNRGASIEVIYALADYFGVSIDYLVGRTDKPEINK
jgi:transcriptional regulator with XRE-family HTH domain